MPFVQTDDATLFVTEAGSPDAPAILFSNSLGTTHRMWDAIVAELSSEFRCIRYDTRGHGASRCTRKPFDIAELAEDAFAVLDNLGVTRVHFVGLSLGGMTGQSLAITHPERLASLCLLATTDYLPPASAWNDRAMLIRREGMASILPGTLQRWFTDGFRVAFPHLVDKIAAEFRTIDVEAYALCCEAIGRMDLRKHIRHIHVPTLIIAGAEDPATPVAMAQRMESAIAGSRLSVLSPAAHLLAVEKPEAVAMRLADHIRHHMTG